MSNLIYSSRKSATRNYNHDNGNLEIGYFVNYLANTHLPEFSVQTNQSMNA